MTRRVRFSQTPLEKEVRKEKAAEIAWDAIDCLRRGGLVRGVETALGCYLRSIEGGSLHLRDNPALSPFGHVGVSPVERMTSPESENAEKKLRKLLATW